MEITFQNRREDFASFYTHMAQDTEEGRRIGLQSLRARRIAMGEYSLAIGCVMGVAYGSLTSGLATAIGLWLLSELVMRIVSKSRPAVWLARNVYRAQEQYLQPRDFEFIFLSRRLVADDDWLAIGNAWTSHRWHWRVVDKVDLTSDFIFLHIGGCPVIYLPKRAFASEQEFAEFGKALDALRAANLGKPIGGE